MRILILNSCSTLNRGDAAIVLGQIRLLQKQFPEVRIAVTSRTPSLDVAFYNAHGVEVLAPLTPAYSTYKGMRRPFVESVRALGNWREKRRLIQVLRQSDLILGCGGGYLYSYRKRMPGTTFWQNVIHAYLAAHLGKPLVFLPQSFGPFSSSLAERAVKRLLEKPTILKIYAREATSYQLLHDVLDAEIHSRIDLCPDMAFYLEGDFMPDTLENKTFGASRPKLIVNLREWDFPGSRAGSAKRLKREAYLNALSIAVHHFVERYDGTVTVAPHAMGPDPSEDDRDICREFYVIMRGGSLRAEDVEYMESSTDSLSEFKALLSGAAVLIGTRLHACVLALLAGVPAISIGYQNKSQGTFEMLGLGRFNQNIDHISPQWLLTAVDNVMSHRPEIQKEVRLGLARARIQIDDEIGGLLMREGVDVGSSTVPGLPFHGH